MASVAAASLDLGLILSPISPLIKIISINSQLFIDKAKEIVYNKYIS